MFFKNDEVRLASAIIAKRLFDDGKTVKEVARMMCLSESKVRSLKKYVDVAQDRFDSTTEEES